MASYFVFEQLALLGLLADQEDEAEEQPSITRRLRDAGDALDVPVEEFRAVYRLDQTTVLVLMKSLEGKLKRWHGGLSVMEQLLTTLKYLGSGEECAGRDGRPSAADVRRCVRTVAGAACRTLLHTWVRFPVLEEDRKRARASFQRAGREFPGALGALGNTRVGGASGGAHNAHACSSLNVQMICDGSARLMSVTPQYSAATEDAYIWQHSQHSKRRTMEHLYRLQKEHICLIGGSSYPLEPWLMTPARDAPAGSPAARYNAALREALSALDECFASLKNRWRCLSDVRSLRHAPDAASRIVYTCAILHNMCLHYNIPEDNVAERGRHYKVHTLLAESPPSDKTLEALRVRDELTKNHFQ